MGFGRPTELPQIPEICWWVGAPVGCSPAGGRTADAAAGAAAGGAPAWPKRAGGEGLRMGGAMDRGYYCLHLFWVGLERVFGGFSMV